MAAPAAPTKKGDGLILTGLMLGILLAALDQTVVGTSLGVIATDLGGFDKIAWLISAYIVGSTIVIPLAGKASDILGRRPVYLMGMGVFLLGSVLCGTAQSMEQLIAYRFLQGLGGGVLFPVVLAAIADLYPPSDRGKPQAFFGAVFGLSSVLGPFLGGGIVDYVHVFGVESWRWIFYVNLPVGLAAITIVLLHFPKLTTKHDKPIDWLGIASLTLAILATLFVTIFGGDTYEWRSPQIVGLGAFAGLMFIAFMVIETRAVDPVVPLSLFSDPIFRVSMLATLLMGVGMFPVLSFLPTFMQGVVGMSATYSGAVLIPLMIGIIAGAQSSGFALKKVGYKIFCVSGTAITAVGFILLSTLGASASIPFAVVYMMVLGVGLGFTMQTFVLAVQNSVPRRVVGTASSTLTLARQLGAALGVSALGVVLNNRLAKNLPEHVPSEALGGLSATVGGKLARLPEVLLRDDVVARIPPAVVDGIKVAYADSMTVVFLASACIAAVAFVVSLTLKSIPMKSAAEYMKAADSEAPVSGAAVASH